MSKIPCFKHGLKQSEAKYKQDFLCRMHSDFPEYSDQFTCVVSVTLKTIMNVRHNYKQQDEHEGWATE